MRPITVNVGPLVASSPLGNAIAAQPGYINLSFVPTGGTNTNTWNGAANIVAGVLTVLTTNAGKIGVGPIYANGLPAGSRIVGPGVNANTWIVSPTIASWLNVGTIRQNTVITLDAPRQIGITTTEAAGNAFTVTGTDAAGNPISETLATNGGSLVTSQSFATVTSASVLNGLVATGQITAAATATSPWVAFDPYVDVASISKQATVTGTVNFTVQVSNDDPNAPGGVAPGAMTWSPDPDATFVGATANLIGSWAFIPLWARVVLNSGSGSVRTTFAQAGD